MTVEKEFFFISWQTLTKYIKFGREELVFKFKDDRFFSVRNCNPYFKKHIGFSYSRQKNEYGSDYLKIEIHNKAKFSFFKLKYGL
jgi:hypothetical protein